MVADDAIYIRMVFCYVLENDLKMVTRTKFILHSQDLTANAKLPYCVAMFLPSRVMLMVHCRSRYFTDAQSPAAVLILMVLLFLASIVVLFGIRVVSIEMLVGMIMARGREIARSIAKHYASRISITLSCVLWPVSFFLIFLFLY